MLNYKEGEELKYVLALEVIINDLNDLFIPYNEGIGRAKDLLAAKNSKALDIEYRMGQALIALEDLGYKILKA